MKDKKGYRDHIEQEYKKTGSWDKTITNAVYEDEYGYSRAFIDLVEHTYKIKIKDVKHLKEITGCKEHTDEELDKLLTEARYDSYINALTDALQEGAKYKDLLKIKPKQYGLPDKWEGTLATDQMSCIKWVISLEFYINEPLGYIEFPNLRDIAREMDAPYSLILECYVMFSHI